MGEPALDVDRWGEVTVLLPEDGASWCEQYDCQAVIDLLGRLDFHVNTQKISEWAAKNRHLPAGTPFEGKWRNSKTPYMVEPMDNLSPSSDVEITTIMKPGQAGATAGAAENKIGFTVDVDPCPLLYVTATDDLGQEFGTKRLNPLLELCGIRGNLKDPHASKNSKSTGDKVTSKIFPGGNILICSYNQAAMLRMMSFQVVIFDEIDTAPASVNREGDPRKIGEIRTTAYEGRKKILIISTPILMGASEIHKAYLSGDQRLYYIPCPHCKEEITLELLDDQYNCRLEYEFLNEAQTIVDPKSVFYPCPHCYDPESDSDRGKIRNYHKSAIYRNDLGHWVPTNPDGQPKHRSYWFDALLCPPGMVSFETLAQEYVDADGDSELMQAYVNLRGAKPWQERGELPTKKDVEEKVAGYERGTVPEWCGIVTAGCDLHKDRLDVEITGFNNHETFSVDWMHIFGKPTYAKGGSLYKFAKLLEEGKIPGNPRKAFIDMRFEPDEVASCAMNHDRIYAIQGVETLPNNAPFRSSPNPKYNGIEVVSVNTGLLKTRTMNSLKKVRLESGEAPLGFPNFPTDYESAFYQQLTNEMRVPKYNKSGRMIGYEWDKRGKHGSHALDCHVYGLAAEEFEVYQLGAMLGLDDGYRDIVYDCLRDPEKLALVASLQ